MAKKRAPSRQPNIVSDYSPIAEYEREVEGRPRLDGSNVASDYDPVEMFEQEIGGRLDTTPRRSRRTAAPLSKESTSASKKNEIPNFVRNYIKDNPETASQSGCRTAWKPLHGTHRRDELDAEWKEQAKPKGLLRKRGQWGKIAKS